jgi:hypothetical protein
MARQAMNIGLVSVDSLIPNHLQQLVNVPWADYAATLGLACLYEPPTPRGGDA